MSVPPPSVCSLPLWGLSLEQRGMKWNPLESPFEKVGACSLLSSFIIDSIFLPPSPLMFCLSIRMLYFFCSFFSTWPWSNRFRVLKSDDKTQSLSPLPPVAALLRPQTHALAPVYLYLSPSPSPSFVSLLQFAVLAASSALERFEWHRIVIVSHLHSSLSLSTCVCVYENRTDRRLHLLLPLLA